MPSLTTRETENYRPSSRRSARFWAWPDIHSLNHSGQFVAVRRLLKKPIAF